jgi:hypothetical protein
VIKFKLYNANSADSDEDVSDGNFSHLYTEASDKAVDSVNRSSLPISKRPWEIKAQDAPDYSVSQEDIGDTGQLSSLGENPDWIFAMRRQQSTPELSVPSKSFSSPGGAFRLSDPKDLSKVQSHTSEPSFTTSTQPSTTPVPMVSVPATPSLIKAVERIHLAHAVIANPSFTASKSSASEATVINTPLERRSSWDAFWSDVKTKAHY